MADSCVDPLTLAYLAGVIDSDGSIGIRRSTYAMRVRGDAGRPVYSERISCKQVQPQAVELLKATFTGNLYHERPSTTKGKPLYSWGIHSTAAGRALSLLRPYLRIKATQADVALALRDLINHGRHWPVPVIVAGEEMITATQFAERVGAKQETVLQACRLGSIPSVRDGRSRLVPVSFIPQYRARVNLPGGPPRPQDMSDAMEAMYQTIKTLNHVGV